MKNKEERDFRHEEMEKYMKDVREEEMGKKYREETRVLRWLHFI